MHASARLVVERPDRESTLTMREEILPVYAASHGDQMRDPWFHPDQFWERLVELYLPGRDFELVVGRVVDEVVGYALGSPRDQHGALWADLRSTYPEWGVPVDPVPMYMFREFAVHPAHQRKGVGRRLHNALLAHRPEPAAELWCVRTTCPRRRPIGRGAGCS